MTEYDSMFLESLQRSSAYFGATAKTLGKEALLSCAAAAGYAYCATKGVGFLSKNMDGVLGVASIVYSANRGVRARKFALSKMGVDAMISEEIKFQQTMADITRPPEQTLEP